MEGSSESKVQRRKRLALKRMAQWAHVKKGGPIKPTFKRFWRKSPYRNPRGATAHLSRQDRRRAAYAIWKATSIRKRGVKRA